MTSKGSFKVYDPLKRLIDITASLMGLALLIPLLILVALLVRNKLGAPILFKQERPGKGGKVFRLYKFRTMVDADPDKGLSTDEQRLTPFGKWLRSTSLDELPELWNVLMGDMSLVGPRPLLMKYLPLYSSYQARRHEVRPGVTGWAQVKGRNSLSWEQRFALDVEYVDNRSLWLDIKILLWTVRAVLLREGIHQEGSATMTEFGGNSSE